MKNLTIRARLTLMYSGLLTLAGLLLLGAMYAVAVQQLDQDKINILLTTDGQSDEPVSRSGPVQDVLNEALTTLLIQGGIALMVISAVAIGLGWLIAGRLLQPLQRITETARRIASLPVADHGLHERIALDRPRDEVKELADTFDVMLEQLDHSFNGQRRFIANASHELRTPLTLNRALLEVAIRRRTASVEVRQLGETLLEINSRHERLIDGLLMLARSDQDLVERSFVDLADLVQHVVSTQAPGTVALIIDACEAPTTGNPVLLERLVQNLVENAIRYNLDEDGWVRLISRTSPEGEAVLEVSNSGPVVPRYDVLELFEPFRRLEKDRLAGSAPGAGLGLSIVHAVARAHGGSVRAEARAEGGLLVVVALPPPPPEQLSTAGQTAAARSAQTVKR